MDPRDEHHPAAHRVHAALRAERVPMTTTILVVAESHALIARRCGKPKGLSFLDILGERQGQHVVWIDPELVRASLENWVARHADKGCSLTDAVSFEVMAREGIREAFAFDLDFERAGFRLLQGR